MLDSVGGAALGASADQSEGLRHWMPQASAQGTRVMAMLSWGEARTEQPLLWQICTSLQGLGHSVAVLDATTAESGDNPGLQNLLDHSHWLENADEDSTWQIVPSKIGLAGLARQALQGLEDDMPLRPLGHLFKNFHIVLIYARAEVLMPLLPGTQMRPLLAIGPSKNSIVKGYQTLKQLLLQAHCMPTLVSLVTGPQKAAEVRATVAARSLQHCAATYLGVDAEVLNVRSFPQQEKASQNALQDVPRLVLRLLESSANVGNDWPAAWSRHADFSAVHLARSQ